MSKKNRKQQIIDAALKIMSEEGIQRLTVLRIAEEVGITDAALYRHFKSKNAIIEAAVQHVGQSLAARMSIGIAQAAEPVDKLQEALRIHLKFFEENRGIPRILYSEAVYQNDPEIRALVGKFTGHYQDIIRGLILRAKEQGAVKADVGIGIAVLVFLGMVQSTVLLWTLSDYDSPISQTADSLFKVFMEGIQK